MIILLEGLDCCGKSSISKQLVINAINRDAIPPIYVEETFKHIYDFHSDSDKWNYFITGFNAQTMNLFRCFDWFIKDRFHLSEYVFSHFMNRISPLSFEKIDEELLNLDKEILVVYLTTTYKTYEKRINKNREKEIYIWNELEFNEVQNLFDKSFNKTKLPKIKIATDEITIKEVSDIIDDEIFRSVSDLELWWRR